MAAPTKMLFMCVNVEAGFCIKMQNDRILSFRPPSRNLLAARPNNSQCAAGALAFGSV
jgi:hypothetical protein